MFSFPKPFPPSCYNGPQGVLRSSPYCSFALGINNRDCPTPFRCSRFGTQRMPLSPVRPIRGVQNSASSVCWAKKKKTNEAKGDQKAEESGRGVFMESREDGELRWKAELEKLILDERFFDSIDATLYDHMPPACDVAWKESQQAWLDLAIHYPISLNNGECSVHTLGIAHGLPTNASALKTVVDAVQPDTIAIEAPPQFSKELRGQARKLAPQLDKLMALGFPGCIREAHMALSPQDRCLWRQVVYEGDLALNHPGSDPQQRLKQIQLMMYGNVTAIEFLAAAHLAPSWNGISLEGIDRGAAEEILLDPGFQQEYYQQMHQITSFYPGWSDGHLAFAEWLDIVRKMNPSMDGISPVPPGYEEFLSFLGMLSVSPAEREMQWRIEDAAHSRMTGKASAYARALLENRNIGMVDCLQQLAEGSWSDDGPLCGRTCIVAVVGQDHVAAIRELAVARN